MPPGVGGPGAAEVKGGGIKRWFAGHKVLAGVGMGILAVALIAGAFAIGYCVGKPSGEKERRIPAQQFQNRGPMPPDLRSAPSPGGGRMGQGRLDVLVEYRDELEGVVAGELGISTTELTDEIAGGKSIAEIAEEKGVSADDLTAAVAAEIDAIADELVAEGEITAAQAEDMKSEAESMASVFIERGNMRPPMPSE
jgi:hypothetical protein